MMRPTIHQWLSSVFGLVIVEDITQTKVEKSISYDLTASPINVRHKSDDMIFFDFEMTVQFRCPNGFAGIGWLSTKLNGFCLLVCF